MIRDFIYIYLVSDGLYIYIICQMDGLWVHQGLRLLLWRCVRHLPRLRHQDWESGSRGVPQHQQVVDTQAQDVPSHHQRPPLLHDQALPQELCPQTKDKELCSRAITAWDLQAHAIWAEAIWKAEEMEVLADS